MILRVRGDAARQLPAVVETSAQPGLPVIAWTCDRLPASDEPLLDLADRVVVDSTGTATILELSNLLALTRRMATIDLAWVALEPWRDAAGAALAGHGGSPSERSISGIEIHGDRRSSVLLAAWLTSRFALEAGVIRLIEASHLTMRIGDRYDERDSFTEIGGFAIQLEAADHHHTAVVEPRSPLEVLDRALGSSGGDPEWEPTLTRALDWKDRMA